MFGNVLLTSIILCLFWSHEGIYKCVWRSVVWNKKANIIPPIGFFHLFITFYQWDLSEPLGLSTVHETHLEKLFNECAPEIELTALAGVV